MNSQKNILVTGASGQLGSEIKYLTENNSDLVGGNKFYFCASSELDICSREELASYCEEYNISQIINCAAYTAVDKAEDEEHMADGVNNKAVEVMAELAKDKSISLVHISTDYVFDGRSCVPYSEDNESNPKSVYGKTKRDGEESMLRLAPPESVIIRTSWVYSSFGNNFVKTMLKLGGEREGISVVWDQIGTPTYARDLAEAVLRIIHQLKGSGTEVYHYSNHGVASWYDFAKAIFEFRDIECDVAPIPSSAYKTKAERPLYSVLSKEKITNRFGLRIPYWRDSLKQMLSES